MLEIKSRHLTWGGPMWCIILHNSMHSTYLVSAGLNSFLSFLQNQFPIPQGLCHISYHIAFIDPITILFEKPEPSIIWPRNCPPIGKKALKIFFYGINWDLPESKYTMYDIYVYIVYDTLHICVHTPLQFQNKYDLKVGKQKAMGN